MKIESDQSWSRLFHVRIIMRIFNIWNPMTEVVRIRVFRSDTDLFLDAPHTPACWEKLMSPTTKIRRDAKTIASAKINAGSGKPSPRNKPIPTKCQSSKVTQSPTKRRMTYKARQRLILKNSLAEVSADVKHYSKITFPTCHNRQIFLQFCPLLHNDNQ